MREGTTAAAPDTELREPSLRIGEGPLLEEPDSQLRSRIRSALRPHRRGDYAASERAFRALSEAHPRVAALRFDLACALARQGRVEESASLIDTLLTEDLPDYLPKFEQDEDLEALRQSPEGAQLRASIPTLVSQYRIALRWGFVVIRDVTEGAREPAEHVAFDADFAGSSRSRQVGVWLPVSRTFVPLGPRLRQAYSDRDAAEESRLVGVQLDRELGVVFGLTAIGSESEGGPEMARRASFGAWEACTGRELGRRAYRAVAPPRIHAHPGGVSYTLGFPLDDDFDPDHLTTASLGAEGRFDGDHRPAISCSGASCTPLYDAPTVRVTRDLGVLEVRSEPTPADRRAIRRAHRRPPRSVHLEWTSGDVPSRRVELPEVDGWSSSSVAGESLEAVDDHRGGVWIVVQQSSSCDWQFGYGASAAFYLDLESGEVTLKRSGRGMMRLRVGLDHSVYLQHLDELWRYVGGEGEGERLPSGLFIDPAVPRVWSLQSFRDC